MTFEDTKERQKDTSAFLERLKDSFAVGPSASTREMPEEKEVTGTCRKCGKTWVDFGYKDYEAICSSCKEQETRAEERKRRILSIPPRFRAVLDSDAPAFDSGILWGNFGTGKTWAMYAKAVQYKDFGLDTEFGILSYIKEGFKANDAEARIKEVKRLDFLGVDEFCKVPESDYNKAIIFEILNHRYEWQLPTLLSVNASTREQLKEIIPSALLDRYRANILEFKGRSRR